MAMPMAQIWLPIAPMYDHARDPDLASCYHYIWPCPWPKLTWIYGVLLSPYMAMPMAQIWLSVAPMHGRARGLDFVE